MYRTEGWREGKGKRAGDYGNGREEARPLPGSPAFSLFPPSPHALSIFRLLLYFYCHTQWKPLRRRDSVRSFVPTEKGERVPLPKLLDSWTSGFATHEYLFVMMHQRSSALTYRVKRRIFSNAKLSFAKLTLSVSH